MQLLRMMRWWWWGRGTVWGRSKFPVVGTNRPKIIQVYTVDVFWEHASEECKSWRGYARESINYPIWEPLWQNLVSLHWSCWSFWRRILQTMEKVQGSWLHFWSVLIRIRQSPSSTSTRFPKLMHSRYPWSTAEAPPPLNALHELSLQMPPPRDP